jgi:hypothetical protein
MIFDENMVVPIHSGTHVVFIRGVNSPYYKVISLPKVSFPGDTECKLVRFSEIEGFLQGVKSEIMDYKIKKIEVVIISETITKNKIDHLKTNMVGDFLVNVIAYEYGDILFPFPELGISGEKRISLYYNTKSNIISLSGSGSKNKDFKSIHNYISGTWFEETYF